MTNLDNIPLLRGNHKFTFKQAQEIREKYIASNGRLSCEALARKYGCHRSTIERIINGKSHSYSAGKV